MADPLGAIIRSIAKYPGAILARTKITPDQVTLLGFLVNCIVAFLIADGRPGLIAAGILIWVAGFFDALDGSIARITGRVTVFGNFFDSVIDRYSDCAIYLGIIVFFARLGELKYVIAATLAMIGSFAVSYARAKAESLDLKCEVGVMPRTVRVVILGASFCIGQVFWGLMVIAIFSHLTVIQRILHVRRTLLKAP